MIEGEKRIKFLSEPVFADGCEKFSFIRIETKNAHKILWALTDRDRETHTEIYRLAIEEGYITDEIEPTGGGVFNAKTGEYIGPSIHFENVEKEILDAIDRKLPSLVNCT